MTRTLVANNKFNPSNLLINSALDYWQRSGGNTVASSTGGGTIGGVSTYFTGPDRWLVRPGGVSSGNITLSSDVPTSDFVNSFRFTDTAGAGSRSFQFVQRIEAAIIKPYIGKTMTFSVWVKGQTASLGSLFLVAGVPTIGLDSWASDPNTFTTTNQSASLTYTLGSWKRHSFTFVVPASAANGFCVDVLANNAAQSYDIFIAGAMLTEGGIQPSFYRNASSLMGELATCQRYFEKSYSVDVAVATATTGGIIDVSFGQNQPAGVSLAGPVRFKVEKRIAPTIAFYTRAGGSGIQRYSNSSSLQDTVAGTANGVGTSGFIANSGATVGTTTGYIDFHYTAAAEL